MDDDLRRLGDALEQAIARQVDEIGHEQRNIAAPATHVSTTPQQQEAAMTTATTARPIRSTRRSRRAIVGAGLGALLLAGAGTAVAVTQLSGDDVAKGLPGGSLLFTGTSPSCTTTDGVVFDCTLASAPTAEVADDWTGAAELFVDADSNIAGGCRALDAEGLRWTCYLGQRAVDEQILAADLLGQ